MPLHPSRISFLNTPSRRFLSPLKHTMDLLDKLWDDTLAGPKPDTGLGKLRKYSTFSLRSNLTKESQGSYGEDVSEEAMKVTRSIMIVKPSGNRTVENNGSPPISPAGSTPPVSPFSGGGGGGREMYKFRRRSASDAYEKARIGGPRSLRSPFDV